MKRISLSTILLAATVVLTTEGCGGAGTGGVPPNPFAGLYDGTVAVNDNRVATLSVTVAADGSATGTLVVTQNARPSREGGSGDFPVGNFTVSGSSTNAGFIAITGIVPPDRTFTINANLPQGSASSPFALVLGSSTYTGTVQPHNGGGGGGTGGTVTLEAINAGNAILTPFPGMTMQASVTTEPGKKTLHLTANDGFIARSFGIDIPDTLQAGQSITYGTGAPFIIYNQNEIGNFQLKAWQTKSGSLTLVSRNGDTFSVTLTNVEFIPVPIGGNTATGSFRATGSLHN